MVVSRPKRYRLFQYSLTADPDLGDPNSFLAAHRVALVTQHMVKTLGGGMLAFIVEPVESSPTKPPEGNQARVDCRERLGTGKFARRVALR
ncbi:MAG: hypothetical protein IT186_00435 [Acidobacteria bacterium]|nr:hypothetical protein [Acidobacteriota bacterium]